VCSARHLAVLLLVVGAAPLPAAAQVYDPSYAVEVYRGALIAPVNIVGMGGAHLSVAEGSAAQAWNPAAIANRYPYDGNDWFTWDWSLDYMGLGTGSGAIRTDLDNDGRAESAAGGIFAASASLGLNFGRFGLGMMVRGQTYDICLDPAAKSCGERERFEYEDLVGHFSLGYAFLDGQLLVGTQLVVVSSDITTRSKSDPEIEITEGAALDVGAVLRPYELPLRLGVNLRRAVRPKVEVEGDGRLVANRLVPYRLSMPWELGVGVSAQLGSRPHNLRYSFGDEELRGEGVNDYLRDYHLIAVDLILVGPSTKAVSAAAWLDQEVRRAGQEITLGVRAGYESEFWDDFLRGRIGTYWEPSRFRRRDGRVHGTAGLDVNLFELFWQWRFTFAVDLAVRYSNVCLSLGFWH
jgi:hypothetical protein